MYYHEAARKSRVSHLSDATKSQRDWVANQRDRVARKGVHSGPQPSEVATGAEPADTAQLATDGGTERHDPVPSDHACGMEYLAQAGVEAPLALCTVEQVSFSDLFPSIAAQVDDYLGRNACLIERSLHVTRFAGYESGNGIWILEMKGCLPHRLELLGCERSKEEGLWPDQIRLRRIAETQVDSFSVKCGWRVLERGGSTHEHGPERPDWSNGAQIYLHPGHAEKIENVLEGLDTKLGSKNIVISNGYLPMLLRLFIMSRGVHTRNSHRIRDVYLIRRASHIRKAWWLSAPEYQPEEVVV